MLKKSIVILALLLTSNVITANSVTTDKVPASPKVKTARTINEIIDDTAKQFNVSPTVMHAVIKCESTYNPRAIGDGGHSRGLVQIYDSFHPTVTHAQAFDPEFAITFLAKNLAQGKGHLWTCYRQLNLE